MGSESIRDSQLKPELRNFEIMSALGVFAILGLLALRANQWGEWYLGANQLASRDLFWWPLLFVVLAFVRFVEGKPFSSIGFRRVSLKTLLVAGLCVVIISLGVVPLSAFLVAQLHLAGSGGNIGSAIMATPFWYRLLLVTRGAVVEEVVFRGYLIERVEALTGSRVLAGIVSVVSFSFAHLALWGWAPLIFVSAAGLVLAIQYQLNRDLWSNIITHWIADALSILV